MGLFRPIRQLFGRRDRSRDALEQFKELAEHSSDMICRIGPDRAKYFSPVCKHLFGWTPEEMIALRPDQFFYPEDMPTVDAATERLQSGSSSVEVCRARVRRKDGSIVWVEMNTRLARNSDGRGAPDMIVVVRDITDRKQREDELAMLALTDPLTGLVNRRGFDEALDQGWRVALGRRGALSLLLIDIDHFKKFNDHFGHQLGDDCLRAVAAALCEAVRRDGTTTARFGGEEFAIVLPGADPAEAMTLAEAAREGVVALRLHHPLGQEPERVVTVSVGAATASHRTSMGMATPTALLAAADMALYRAKHRGRNCVEGATIPAGEAGEAA